MSRQDGRSASSSKGNSSSSESSSSSSKNSESQSDGEDNEEAEEANKFVKDLQASEPSEGKQDSEEEDASKSDLDGLSASGDESSEPEGPSGSGPRQLVPAEEDDAPVDPGPENKLALALLESENTAKQVKNSDLPTTLTCAFTHVCTAVDLLPQLRRDAQERVESLLPADREQDQVPQTAGPVCQPGQPFGILVRMFAGGAAVRTKRTCSTAGWMPTLTGQSPRLRRCQQRMQADALHLHACGR